LETRKRKPKFKKGQRVFLKGEPKSSYGIVVSEDPATIGDKKTTKLPGGPIRLHGFVYVRWNINGKNFICLENIKDLDRA
jgi:hypothetical protein